MTSADDHAVGAPLERAKHEQRIHAAGAGNADDLDIRRIGQTVGAGQIGARIGAPVAAEGNDLRLKFVVYLHIASTSAMIWLLEKPFRSIAPEGQATVQAPHPWQTASLTEATRRRSLVRLGPVNSLSE